MSPTSSPPLVIAHRGASGLRPEHTLEAYRVAAQLGADVIEPDLVFTKDGHLICRHDRHLSGSTNISVLPHFAGRKTLKDGHNTPDWFAEDFTLAEIKTLRARQPFDGRSKLYDDQFEVPTFAELLVLAKQQGWRLYPEAKQPAVAAANGHDFLASLQPFLEAAAAGDIGPSFLQCFDPTFFNDVPKLKNVERIQLLGGDVLSGEALEQIATYAEGIGPYKLALLEDGLTSTGMVDAAHAVGLKVHPYTFRSDALQPAFFNAQAEYAAYFDLGVDGVFSDFTGDAIRARTAWRAMQ